MILNYPVRSRFLDPCQKVIRKNIDELLIGKILTVQLSEQGYDMDAQITISSNDPKHFQTNWEGSQRSRFSSRIRAAALALYNQGCFGTFRITHHIELLTIQKVGNNAILYKKVAKSQYTDGVRINKSFHDLFNPPTNKSYVGRGESTLITIRFNKKKFAASYLHENPRKVDREMQSIRFSKELKDEFKTVFPDKSGYFSIELGSNVNEFIFDVTEYTDQIETETFAKKYIRQEHGNLNAADIDKILCDN